MKVEFKKLFLKQIKSIRDKHLKEAIYQTIIEVESANSIKDIKNLKKLKGFDSYYRIRIGDYRIGIKFENKIFYFVVFEHRKDIYKTFP
jgi:mRNA interferase RelE/StbE